MKIILASSSPRRKLILEKMGLNFKVIPSDFEEYFDQTKSPAEVAIELAVGKANKVAKDNPDAIVIGSDLIVVLDNKQIGKPQTDIEAKQMLKNFSNRAHTLVCSVAVICLSKNYLKTAVENSEIFFDELSDEVIDNYVETGTVYDKAGGYAIQHPLIKPHALRINGRIDTIIGLPTNIVSNFLSDFGLNYPPIDENNYFSNSGFFE